MNHFAIRADGSSEIGYGHLVRTSVLAKKLYENNYQITYLTQTPSAVSNFSPTQTNTYQLGKHEVGDTLTWLNENEPDALLTDSYRVDTSYQEKLYENVQQLITITDDTRFTLKSDLNINGNIHAPDLNYNWNGKKPEMLLGTEYLIIREEFQQIANENPPWRDSPERALITFGGSDINNVTPDVVRAFDGFELEVDVIIGPGFTNENEIMEATRRTNADFNLWREPDNLPQLMFDADFAVSAVGSTVYELLLTGTPVIGAPQSSNQVPIFEELSSRDVIHAIELDLDVPFNRDRSSASPKLLKVDRSDIVKQIETAIVTMITNDEYRFSLRNRGQSLVDGRGPIRVYREIMNLI